MRLSLFGVGTTGDVLPLALLGAVLQRRGHEVSVATYADFAPLLARHGLRHVVVPGESRRILVKQVRLDHALLPLRLLRMRKRAPQVRDFLFRLADAFLAAGRDADAIVFASTAAFGASIAEYRDIPSVHVAFTPLTATGAFPYFACPVRLPPGWANRATHRIGAAMASLPYRAVFNDWRRERLGLPPLPPGPLFARHDQPTLYGFAAAVLPRPADWGKLVAIGGSLQPPVPDGFTPPPALAAFLRDGPPPVYVGFGSMVTADPARTMAVVLGALARLGVRAVLRHDGTALSAPRAGAQVCWIDDVPHAWLFPRMGCVVHHGGNGTAGAAVAAGVPQVIVPHIGDQFFWGRRMARLGVAPPPLPVRHLSAARLADRIRTALECPLMRQRASELARLQRADRGADAAADFIETTLQPSAALGPP
jgi:UDP:flavonoid glycosyltransferase YjiC (YdhE family)